MAEISPNWNALYSNQGFKLQGNPALDDLRERYATQQAQKAQDNANFTSQIAKLNFGGAKDSDLDYLHKQYGDILNTFGQLRNTNDPKQRAQLGLQLQQKQNGFLYDIEKSKDTNKQAMDATNLLHNPNADLVDEAPSKILALHNKSSFDKDYDQTYNDTMTGLFNKKPVDLTKIYSDAFSGTKSTSKTTGEDVKDKVTGEFKTPTYNTTDVKPQDFANHILMQLKGDKKKQDAVVKAYPNLSHDQAIAKFIADGYAMKQNQLGTDTTYSAPHESYSQKRTLTPLQQWNYSNSGNPNSPDKSVQPTPVQPQTVSITFKTQNSDKSPMTMNLRNFTPVNIPKATMIPTTGIDDDGDEVKIPAGEVRVIGYGEKPVLNTDITTIKNGVKSTVKKGSLVQAHYEAAHPDQVTYEKVAHVQQDKKGFTKNYFIPQESVGVNNMGQKTQQKAIKDISTTYKKANDPLGVL